jgi:protoporphyrinogen oxidase
MMTINSERWAVVGGGMLGLTLAHRLSLKGCEVTLYEGAPSFGGLAGAWSLGDVVWDRHYHVTLLSDTHLRRLLGELGLDEEMKWVETRTGFYTDGRLYSMSNTVEFLTFPPLNLIDKLRLGATIFYASRVKDWRRLETIPVADWLRRLSGRRTFERIWLPLLRAKLGENYKDTSAAFIWTTIARMYAARRTGLKKEMFGYLPGGYARLLDRFAEALTAEGVRMKAGARVSRVEAAPGGGVRLHVNGRVEHHDRVVLTAPCGVVADICPQLGAEEKALLRGVKYQGIVCASVLLRQPLSRFYVTNITSDWVPFTAVIEMTALVDPAQFNGLSLVYLPKYLPADAPEFGLSDEEIKEKFLGALMRMHPHVTREDVAEFKVSRVRHVFPLPTLGYSRRVPETVTSVPGVYVVNSAHILNGTLNVNETVRLADEKVERLLADSARLADAPGRNYGVADEANCELVARPR